MHMKDCAPEGHSALSAASSYLLPPLSIVTGGRGEGDPEDTNGSADGWVTAWSPLSVRFPNDAGSKSP